MSGDCEGWSGWGTQSEWVVVVVCVCVLGGGGRLLLPKEAEVVIQCQTDPF